MCTLVRLKIRYNSFDRSCFFSFCCFVACSKCDSGRCTSDGQCCHPYCLGGCSGVGKHECYACKNVFVENTNQCADKCPDNHYLVKKKKELIIIIECKNGAIIDLFGRQILKTSTERLVVKILAKDSLIILRNDCIQFELIWFFAVL